MLAVDFLGYVASALVLGTFYARSPCTLRWVAMASNVAFMAYAGMAGLAPVLILHSLLLPLNFVRWWEHRSQRAHGLAIEPSPPPLTP